MKWYLKVLKEYTNFEGRARRTEYWMFALFNFLIFIPLYAIDVFLFSKGILPIPMALSAIYFLAVLLPSISVLVRRLHDVDKSGWWYFISFVPLVGSFILLFFLVQDGTVGDNQFGSNPKGVTDIV